MRRPLTDARRHVLFGIGTDRAGLVESFGMPGAQQGERGPCPADTVKNAGVLVASVYSDAGHACHDCVETRRRRQAHRQRAAATMVMRTYQGSVARCGPSSN